jgi:hypothetical protein
VGILAGFGRPATCTWATYAALAPQRNWESRRSLAGVPQESVTAILKTVDVAGTIEWYRLVGFEIRGVFPESSEPDVV